MAMSKQKIQLSVAEKAHVAVVVVRGLFTMFLTLITGLFAGEDTPPTFRRHVIYSTMRSFITNCTIRQSHALMPDTYEVYKSFLANRGLKEDVLTLDDGTRCLWVGNKKAKNVMLYFHGGGYVYSMTDGHMQLLLDNISAVKAQGADLTVLILAYVVAPEAQYPNQLKQAISSLQDLVEVEKRDPRNIYLGGDSAGGNLTLAVLSHLSHPHSQIPPLKLSEKLGGAALLSPWVTFDQSAASMQMNKNKDCLSVPALKVWSEAFMGAAAVDYYNTPLSATPSWWNDIAARAIFIVAGGDEVFVDDIKAFAKRITINNPSVSFHVTERESHDALMLDYIMGFGASGAQNALFTKWNLEHIKA